MNRDFTSNYQYFYVMSALICLLTLSMAVSALRNKQLPHEKSIGFGVPFILVGAVVIIDAIVVRLCEVGYTGYNLIKSLESIQLAVAPVIIMFFVNNTFLVEKKHIIDVVTHVVTIGVIILCLSNIFFNVLFYVDERGFNYLKPYWVYSGIWVAGVFYMISTIWRFMSHYQCRNGTQLNATIVFLISGLSVHLFDSDLHFSWFSSSIAIIMCYLHFMNVMNDVDPMTELLCQGAWANEIRYLNRKATVIIFDINDFKIINDTYGHQEGDEIIKVVSSCIRKAFSSYGYTYRIGGDEFAVLMTHGRVSPELVCKNFVKLIDQAREQRNTIPTVSYGYAHFNPLYIDSTIYDVIKDADSQMYKYKKQVKEEKAMLATNATDHN